MSKQEYSLVYITDAYCGWCYGFSNSIATFYRNNPQVAIEVISGGLFINERSLPVSEYPHIPAANQRIHEATGAIFGDKYNQVLREGTMVLNSADAAAGLSALKALDATRGVEYIAAMQRAVYLDGKSLSDEGTYLNIAQELGLAGALLVQKFKEPARLVNVEDDFTRAQKLKVEGYPTLLLKQGETYTYLGGSLLQPEEIEAKIKSLVGSC